VRYVIVLSGNADVGVQVRYMSSRRSSTLRKKIRRRRQ